MAGVVIKSSMLTEIPVSFAQTRHGSLIFANGLDKPQHWDGVSATSDDVGIIAPASGPSILSPGSGNSEEGDYNFYYRYVAERAGVRVFSNMSPVTTHAAAEDDQFEWTTLANSTQSRVTHIELWRSTVAQNRRLFRIANIGQGGSITSSTGGTVVFTLPAGHGIVAGQLITVAGHSEGTFNTTFQIASVTTTTVTTGTTASGTGTGGTWFCSGLKVVDTSSDAALFGLSGDDVIAVRRAGGLSNINSNTVPPDFKSVVTNFQDRMVYGVDAVYSTGTVTTNGTTTLTGSGTAWKTHWAGRYVWVAGEEQIFKITTVDSTTSITLDRPATTSGGSKAYAIRPGHDERNRIYVSEQDMPESAQLTIDIQESLRDNDEMTGLIPLSALLIVGKQHTLYAVTWQSQPDIDAQPSLLLFRGLLNQRCWDEHEGTLYLMDDQGPYALSGSKLERIDLPIHDYWRDGDVLLTDAKTKYYSVGVDPSQHKVYFRVQLTGDTTAMPQRAMVWDIDFKKWSKETYVWPVGGSCKLEVSSRQRMLVGAHDNIIYLANEGLADGIATAVTGTVTSSADGTVTDSTASFATTAIHASVAIISGTGKRQIRRITARTGTQLTIDSNWTTNPVAGDKYIVGGIEWLMKSSRFDLLKISEPNRRYVRIGYSPTTNAADLDMRFFRNHSTSAETFTNEWKNIVDGVTIDAGDDDVVCDLKLTQNTEQNDIGSKEFPLEIGHMNYSTNQGDRYLQVELRGYQSKDSIRLSQLEFGGIEKDDAN